ncbi:E3 ubiquitin-protein ligase ATL31 [Spinacia oleracea]|uniref:RING-type E3 ubiquitin transferase n=1 Tax=Spinacia oleracea TaxID=3562 RepID=A0A9R0JBW7_SPIOL|nr:E3 ubiquitin-protein ligase ATL31-like [Spinacia oleracea]
MPWASYTHPHGPHLCFLLVFLLTPPITAQQPPPDWPETPEPSSQNYNSPMATALIVMIIVFFTVGFISVYLRHFLACLGITSYGGFRRGGGGGVGGGGWTRSEPPRGLDPTVVNAFPTFLYSDVKVHRVGKTTALECAICINEFTDHERLVLLPKCNHVFHPHCLSPWLASHVTCPVCRANLETQVPDRRTFEERFEMTTEDEPEPDPTDHNRDVIIRVEPSCPEVIIAKSPTQEIIMKGLSDSGRMIRLPRSHSTGHSLVEDCDRFTLRLPDEVRNKLVVDMDVDMDHHLCGLPAAIVSPRVGYRANYSMGCAAMQGKPDRWRFSMSPPFISRPPGTPKCEDSFECNNNANSKNNNTSGINNVLRSPGSLFKSMKSPNKSPLNHVLRCNDIGERSSDKLFANRTPRDLDLEDHQ